MDQQQYADFLRAARDWQEKTQKVVEDKEWRRDVEPYRLKDIINRPQPDKDVAEAQLRITSIAFNVSLEMGGCEERKIVVESAFRSIRLGVAGVDVQSDLEEYSKEQGELREKLSLFAKAVDSYSRKRFSEIPMTFAIPMMEYYEKYKVKH